MVTVPKSSAKAGAQTPAAAPATLLSIFDMDRTITRRGTYARFLAFMVARHAPWRAMLAPLAGLGALGYAAKLVDRARLKTWNQRLFLGARPQRSALALDAHADKVLADNVYRDALALIERDRAEGRTIVLATASYELYVDAIARRLGIEHVLATRLHERDGAVLPRLIGDNCYDTAKIPRIEALMATQGWDRDGAHIRAYSDHVSDLPMLEYADEPVAVNPSAALRGEARRRGWPIVDFER